jgi:hypothetical protein
MNGNGTWIGITTAKTKVNSVIGRQHSYHSSIWGFTARARRLLNQCYRRRFRPGRLIQPSIKSDRAGDSLRGYGWSVRTQGQRARYEDGEQHETKQTEMSSQCRASAALKLLGRVGLI